VPVVLQGSVVDPVFAQAALDEGIADLVEMTRSQIAEPDLVAHVRAGTPERIRPCTLSNQHSAVRDPRNPIVSDEAEPRAGHETEDPPVPPPASRPFPARESPTPPPRVARFSRASRAAPAAQSSGAVTRRTRAGGHLSGSGGHPTSSGASTDDPDVLPSDSPGSAGDSRVFRGSSANVAMVADEELDHRTGGRFDGLPTAGGARAQAGGDARAFGGDSGENRGDSRGFGGDSGEKTGDSRTRTSRARCSVLVVGGGPGGMEAARVLALRGHRVRVVERAARLGGALLLAAAVGGRDRMGVLVPWWERELIRLGVAVETGVEADVPELDAAERAGTGILLATGSRSGPRPYASDAPVLSAADFEAGVLAAGSTEAALARLPAGVVVVHDPIGDWTGVGVAEQVAATGRRVAIITRDAVAGVQLSRTGDLVPANTRLQRAGVARELYSLLRGVHGGRAVLEHIWTGERREIDCAAVIDCGHRLPEDGLWAARAHLPRTGDCIAPRTVYEAVLEARRAAADFVTA
jgi:hypothetical protein